MHIQTFLVRLFKPHFCYNLLSDLIISKLLLEVYSKISSVDDVEWVKSVHVDLDLYS